MILFKKMLIASTLSILSLSAAHAKPTLPFVGSAEVNWYGGNATNEVITITKNGNVTIIGETIDGQPVTIYKGKFTNPLKISDGNGSYYYYKFIGNKKISMLDKNKKVSKECFSATAENIPCIQTIEVFKN